MPAAPTPQRPLPARTLLAALMLAGSFGLAGCAHLPWPAHSAQALAPTEALLDDTAFAPAPPAATPDPEALFRLSPAMRTYLQQELLPAWRRRGVQHGLVAALQRGGQLRLDYDSSTTRTAAEAFAERAGNCLSLAAMTAAFASELGLEVQFYSVPDTLAWEHQGNLLVDQSHVNLGLVTPASPFLLGQSGPQRRELIIDFLPGEDLRLQPRDPIDARRVQAMYLNNRAVELLATRGPDAAYPWARAAVRHDPGHTAAWNTLAVLYLRKERHALALSVLQHALAAEPDHEPALANLVPLLRALGRPQDAQAALARREAVASRGSLQHYEAGLQALARQEWPEARQHLLRALRRTPEHADVHFALARAEAGLGRAQAAAHHLALAARHSPSAARRAQYQGKLERLRLQHRGQGG